jgi:hypothetical protein
MGIRVRYHTQSHSSGAFSTAFSSSPSSTSLPILSASSPFEYWAPPQQLTRSKGKQPDTLSAEPCCQGFCFFIQQTSIATRLF